jgi:hypothetical protein
MGAQMTTQAKGGFEVKMTPQTWSESSVDHTLARFSLDKQYHGDLEATAQGQMMSSGSGTPGSSAVYVALEKVTGSLHGRKGSFVLYHVGIMRKGVPELTITIAPDSGTDELTGLAGTLKIDRTDGKHSYELDYTLVTLQ